MSKSMSSCVLAFPLPAHAPHSAQVRPAQDRRLLAQERTAALASRQFWLDPSSLEPQAQRFLAVLLAREAVARSGLVAEMVTVIGSKGGISLSLGQFPVLLAERLCRSFWLKRLPRGARCDYVLSPMARRVLETDPMPGSSPSERSDFKPAPRLNTRESPLLWLARRKNAQGQAHLSPTQVMAGERLRRDYTAAGMTPKMTANLLGLPVAGATHGHALTQTEAMLDARQRMRRALLACSREQADVLLDLCCFLKPLEQVERERGWPARQGKYRFAQALTQLARHYGLNEAAQGRQRAKAVTVWRGE